MRLPSLLLGFAAGVLALSVFLYATGRLKTTAPLASETSVLPTPAPPDTAMPQAAPITLPAPPNLSLNAATQESSGIGLPLPNLKRESIQDTFNDVRGGGKHKAADILAPRGTPVFAVVEGNAVKLFNSKKGGTTVYQYDNQQKYCYYYAHLDRYADGLKEGMLLRKGYTLGFVGTTGDAQPDNPHLHFEIMELGPDKHYYEHTKAIDPYPLLVHALTAK